MRCILFLTIILTSCSTTKKLPSGAWSGYFSSMDKPDNRISLTYEVVQQQDSVSLQIFGPRGMNMQTNGIEMTKDTLFFTFIKMDQSGSFSCGLKKVNKNYYYGRCTDTEGRWAIFTMKHNSLDFSKVNHKFGGCPCHS